MNQQNLRQMIKISSLGQTRITVSFSYNPNFVQKVKLIKGYTWHPEGKYWSFPNTNGTLEKILKVFEGHEINLDPALQNVIVRDNIPKQPQHPTISIPTLVKGDKGGFEDLRKELVSRKYSYKTIKSYLQILQGGET